MIRKDCEGQGRTSGTRQRPSVGSSSTLRASLGRRIALSAAALVVLWCHATALGAPVRVYSTAVVTGDAVRIADLCDLRHLSADDAGRFGGHVVAEAPPPGGSRAIALSAVRDALSAAGANVAKLTLSGAAECAVTRPADAPVSDAPTQASNHTRTDEPTIRPTTLRRSVTDFFAHELSRYRGIPEVVFDRGAESLLDLAGPPFEFHVRRTGGGPLDLAPIEVDIIADGRLVQTAPMVVRVKFSRPTVVARHPINQGGTIRESDVEVISMSYTRLDRLGLDDPALCVGQRAKRFIAPGTQVESAMLEPVPLVVRGQLVTATSHAGAIRVVTTAKADADGMLGETIVVRSVDDRKESFPARVVGPGKVELGDDDGGVGLSSVHPARSLRGGR